MDLPEFLRLRDVTLAAVIAEMKAVVGLEERDLLLAVGSLVEGLGTPKSDVDLFLISARSPDRLPPNEYVTLVVGRCLVDLRVIQLATLEALLDRFFQWTRSPWNVTHALKFSIEDRTLLHRILHGQVLHQDQGDQIRSRLPSPLELARLKLHVARQAARTIQVDMVGNRENRDYRSLVTAGQELMGHAIDGLVAGYRLTNPLLKWRSRMLERVAADWERRLIVHPSGMTANQRIWDLHRAPAAPDEDAALTHAFGVSAFARAAFYWAEQELVLAPEGSTRPLAWGDGASSTPDLVLPPLDFDVDFVVAGERAAVAHLNEFDAPLELTAHELVAVLLFDGVTTRNEVATAVFPDAANGREFVDGLAARLLAAGLTFAVA